MIEWKAGKSWQNKRQTPTPAWNRQWSEARWKKRKARAATLGGRGGDWKIPSCGCTTAGFMAGVNGRQTNKYSTAAGTGDNHDDFTGYQIPVRVVICANAPQNSTGIRLNRRCWHWRTDKAAKPMAATGAGDTRKVLDCSPAGCNAVELARDAMLEDCATDGRCIPPVRQAWR